MNQERLRRSSFRIAMVASLLTTYAAVWAQSADDAGDMETSPRSSLPPLDLSTLTYNPHAARAHANNAIVYGQWNGPPLTDGIPSGFKVVEGDILVPDEFEQGGVAATYSTNSWTNGIVPYVFSSNVTPANASAMLVAMGWWENVAAVDFIPATNETNYIYIQNSTGNNSPVGMIGFAQVVNIFNWNITAVMAHELGHTLGYWHEQGRLDRNTYVTINNANICQNCCSGGSCTSQFQVELSSDNYGPYDFDSVMHYGRCSFSTNPAACNASCPSLVGETIVVNPPYYAAWHCATGQRTHLSYWDKLVMSFLYPRANWRFQDSDAGSDLLSPGDFFSPYASFWKGVSETPEGGTLWLLRPSTLSAGSVLDKAMTIAAPVGGVTLTP